MAAEQKIRMSSVLPNRNFHEVGKPMPKRTGEKVVIEADVNDPWCLDAKWRGVRVGYVSGILENNRLLIGEFIVENARHIPWRILNDLRVLLNIRCPQRNFRGHGIGSKLIDAVIFRARQAGISEIWGSIIADDVQATEHLLPFYLSRGFTIVGPDEECLKNAAKKIVLMLSSQN